MDEREIKRRVAAIEAAGGSLGKAAARLGMTRTALESWAFRYGVRRRLSHTERAARLREALPLARSRGEVARKLGITRQRVSQALLAQPELAALLGTALGSAS